MRKALLQLAVRLARAYYEGKPVTFIRDYGDGGELEEVFTGTVVRVATVERIMTNAKTGYEVRLVVMGEKDKHGFAECEYVDMRKVQWNKEKLRFEASKSVAKAGTPSSSTRHRTSDRASLSRLQMGDWRGRAR